MIQRQNGKPYYPKSANRLAMFAGCDVTRKLHWESAGKRWNVEGLRRICSSARSGILIGVKSIVRF